jgi:hypothetical protein
MPRNRFGPACGTLSLVTTALLIGGVLGEDQPPQRRDVGKSDIEGPVKHVLASAAAPAKPAPAVPTYRTKGVIEKPTKAMLANAAEAPARGADNPKVQPGKVRWHAAFADACARSAVSGKPVLLFQMMGKLDDRFC